MVRISVAGENTGQFATIVLAAFPMRVTDQNRQILTAGSLACTVAAALVILLWFRSYWASDSLGYVSAPGLWMVQSHRGGIYFITLDRPRAAAIRPTIGAVRRSDPASWPTWPQLYVRDWDREIALGFGQSSGDGFSASLVPFWSMLLVLMLLPLWWWRHPQRKKWRRDGMCRQCGYDLRGSTDRCPECGTSFKRPAAIPVPRQRR